MTNTSFPRDTFAQAQSVIEAWKEIDPALQVGDLSLAVLESELQQVTPLLAEIDSLDVQLTNMRNQRDTLMSSLWEKLKRARAGIKGIYGDDSSQYEMVGGTRLSERKPTSRGKTA